jgi:hypothetical protein
MPYKDPEVGRQKARERYYRMKSDPVKHAEWKKYQAEYSRQWRQKNREKYRRRNRERSRKYYHEYVKKRKIEVIMLKGGKCELCGYDKSVDALQFHHPNGEREYDRDFLKKSFDLSKVQLLCANCHCIVHAARETGFKEKR